MAAPVAAGVDFYDIEDQLTDEEKIVRRTARSFVENEVKPIIEDHYERGAFPVHLIPRMAELGMLGAHIEGYGCAGMGPVSYGLLCQELERGDSGLRSFISVQGSLSMHAIYAFGSEEQKTRWLPRMAKGEVVGCFGLTEPDFGSNPAGLATRAVRTSEGWVLNGNKMWITNGSIADLAVVWARTEEGIRGFLIEKGAPGFTTTLTKGKLSMRASVTSELHFEDCRVPPDSILPGSNGVKSPLLCLNQARYGIAWGALGAAQACFETAVAYAKERVQFGSPIAAYQLVQRKLALMLTEITLGQLLVLRVGRLKERGLAHHSHVSMAKMNNVSKALAMCRTARDILGANGIVNEYPVMRHACNLESVNTYEGTEDIHLLVLGEVVTGIPSFTRA